MQKIENKVDKFHIIVSLFNDPDILRDPRYYSVRMLVRNVTNDEVFCWAMRNCSCSSDAKFIADFKDWVIVSKATKETLKINDDEVEVLKHAINRLLDGFAETL